MTRKEERIEASIDYQMSINPIALGGAAFDDMIRKMNVNRGFVAGAEWADSTAWKPADGDNLPEIDKEVIALVEENGHYKVVFAHRPPEYWDGRNFLTDEVTRNYTKRYDKGEWNQPNVKWWLDLELPKMEE